ncbi:threonine/serine exporter family protein [Gordonia sp. X0973]|uniref:threonine/serine exporter family protein n=1 Tax=Gordonia sp. X0973 TaxID=2742602 RepID=UPI00101D59AF|nr:threonine/serine exporter family protein [Gordonia sp. X0973]QKT07444.1 threonine/serine exporter family protein [Gordonia sp. X0973]
MSTVEENQRFVTRLGASLMATIAPSPTVDQTLAEVGEKYGVRGQSAVLPRGAITIDRAAGSVVFEKKPREYRLDQTEAVLDLVGRAGAGEVTAGQGLARLDEIDAMRPSVGAAGRFLGIVLIIVGLCLNQNPGLHELIVAAALSVVTAAVSTSLSHWGSLSLFSSTFVAFVATLPVAVLTSAGYLHVPAQVIVPLLALFTQGAALTIAILEISMGAMQTGVNRLIGSILQLFLLAFGIIVAVSIAPTPHPTLTGADAELPIGIRFAGVLLYAIGACLAFCAPRAAFGWLFLVIVVSWAVQAGLAEVVPNGYAPSFVGALVGVAVAELVHRYLSGPAALVSLNQIFRILAPGGLTLLGVTSATTHGSIGGTADIGHLVFTFIAVALGMAAGHVLTDLRTA